MIKTIKTKQFKIIAALLAVVLTASCVLWNTTEVHALEITGANTSGYTVFGGGTIVDGKLVGTNGNPATIGVFITSNNVNSTSDAEKYTATNTKWTHDGTGWKSDSTVLYEGANSQQQIYACAPYTAEASTGSVTVTAAEQADWLVATSTALSSSSVSLTMTHALTKLVIVPTFGTEVTNQTIAKIEIGGMYASGDLNIAGNTWSNLSDTNATLKMTNNEALVIPINCASFTVAVTMADGRVFKTTATCPEGGLAGGTQYNIALQIGQDKVTIGGITAKPWGNPVDGGKLETE